MFTTTLDILNMTGVMTTYTFKAHNEEKARRVHERVCKLGATLAQELGWSNVMYAHAFTVRDADNSCIGNDNIARPAN